MKTYSTRPAVEFPLADLAELFTRSFAGYFIPINMTVPALAGMLRRDGSDLAASRVLLADGEPAGIAVIARRGWTSRLAGMGIAEAVRGSGAGSYLMEVLIHEARERGEHGMQLEVIGQNTRAIGLYEKYGFKKVRRLVGLSLTKPATADAANLADLDIREVAALVSLHGLPDLPWQLSGETLATYAPPARACRLGAAYAVISDPGAEHVSFHNILVEPPASRQGQATRLVRAILSAHPGKTWHVPAIFPEEIIGPFEKAGFAREELFQFQMHLQLV